MKNVLIMIVGLFAFHPILKADEGMYPLTMIKDIDLREKGFELSDEALFNPGGVSLINAIVRVNGCTGSFVSDRGLIITNHHCAFRAANTASDTRHDYIRDGFLAPDAAREIPARGYTVRITESYRDISDEVLNGLDSIDNPLKRREAIEKRIKQLTARAEEDHPGKRAEISEMFKGEQYLLFIYTFLKDIRLVYIPPRAIGEFGGDIDNYEWPRHTGDFSFLRAYVAPDGSPADYSPENVPYKPDNYLRINAHGVDEGDFVFILGYPGRSYRNRSAAFFEFEAGAHLPLRLHWYQWLIDTMQKISSGDRAVALKHLSRIKSLANLEKRYRGRLQGLARLHLAEKRRMEEKAMRERFPHIKTTLNTLDSLYAAKAQRFPLSFWIERLQSDVLAFNLAGRIINAARERAKTDLERKSPYMDRNWPRTRKNALLRAENFYLTTDKTLLNEILTRLLQLPEAKNHPVLQSLDADINKMGAVARFTDDLYAHSTVYKKETLRKALDFDSLQVSQLDDAFIKFRKRLDTLIRDLSNMNRTDAGILTRVQPHYSKARKSLLQHHFIPDANGTLRLTYGHISGSNPKDAVFLAPVTTVTGIAEKHTGRAPFNAPDALLRAMRNHNNGPYYNARVKGVPVCILYDCDTIGGNSGSPVMDAHGRLIGVNFDRAFEGTINDYAYSKRYSRSIAVDIRYVLWILHNVAHADALIKELSTP